MLERRKSDEAVCNKTVIVVNERACLFNIDFIINLCDTCFAQLKKMNLNFQA